MGEEGNRYITSGLTPCAVAEQVLALWQHQTIEDALPLCPGKSTRSRRRSDSAEILCLESINAHNSWGGGGGGGGGGRRGGEEGGDRTIVHEAAPRSLAERTNPCVPAARAQDSGKSRGGLR